MSYTVGKLLSSAVHLALFYPACYKQEYCNSLYLPVAVISKYTVNYFNPLTAQIEIKGQTTCAELLVVFCLFFQLGYHAKCEIMLQSFLFPFELIQLQNSKQTKKSSPKNLY